MNQSIHSTKLADVFSKNCYLARYYVLGFDQYELPFRYSISFKIVDSTSCKFFDFVGIVPSAIQIRCFICLIGGHLVFSLS